MYPIVRKEKLAEQYYPYGYKGTTSCKRVSAWSVYHRKDR